ncbi:hypothetical protein RSOL_372700, partial [Rhizoctonia solani AG-3 Rhs1AP]
MSFSTKPSSKLVPGGSLVNPSTALNLGSFANSGSFPIGSLNKLSGLSSNDRSQEPHIINFTADGNGWRKGATEKWYKSQPSTKFKYLEYRKEKVSPFYHEYIVVHLENETVCRFDRRGDVNNRANVFVGEPIPSEDTAHVIAKRDKDLYPIIERDSELLLHMRFPKGQDILTILGICYGIQSTKATQYYSLTGYNCYFFSWTVIIATARCTVDWATLAQEDQLWEALVGSVMNGLSQDQTSLGPFAVPKSTITTRLGMKGKTDLSIPTHFVSSVYLCNTFRNVLVQARGQIRKSLAELILCSTVDKAMHEILKTSAHRAGSQAVRIYATQAASDVAMEVIIEALWRDIISNNAGNELWKAKCELAKSCVEAASSAIAGAGGYRIIGTPSETPAIATSLQSGLSSPTTYETEIPTPSVKWATAWDKAWEKRWTKSHKKGSDDDALSTSISDRAKADWIKAWDDVCKANEQYVHLISRGVAEYVTKNLPEALPEVLQYGTETNAIKNMVKGLIPTKFEGYSHAQLQNWVKARIQSTAHVCPG